MSAVSENFVDLAIYVGALDYFREGQWLPQPPMPPLPEGVEITVISLAGERALRRKKINDWRDRVAFELGKSLSTSLQWDETDARYVVATPGMTCWKALMLWAAYAEVNESPPLTQTYDASDDLIFNRLDERKSSTRFDQFLMSVDYWLPASFETILQSTGPYGERALIGSSAVLLAQLQVLNNETWQASQQTIEDWSALGRSVDGKLDSQARFGFAELLIATQHACDRGMPMVYYVDPSASRENEER